MSRVTNIILSVDSHNSIKTVNAIERGLRLWKVNNDLVGGSKSLEGELYIGAFNHLDTNKFMNDLVRIYNDFGTYNDGVLDKDDIQVFMKGQDDNRYEEVDWKDWL